MISPYVRRLRLAAELRALRMHAGVTHVQLAKQIGQSRAQISRLENGHVVDQDDVMKILDALGVDDDRWTEIMTIAREAGERGWWESNRLHGRAPGAVRQPRGRGADHPRVPDDVHPGPAADPRVHPGPQRGRPGGGHASPSTPTRRPTAASAASACCAGRVGRAYEVIIDELAIRRASAPPEVIKAQLYHIAATVNGSPKITARVLPVEVDDRGLQRPPVGVLDLHVQRSRRSRPSSRSTRSPTTCCSPRATT